MVRDARARPQLGVLGNLHVEGLVDLVLGGDIVDLHAGSRQRVRASGLARIAVQAGALDAGDLRVGNVAGGFRDRGDCVERRQQGLCVVGRTGVDKAPVEDGLGEVRCIYTS